MKSLAQHIKDNKSSLISLDEKLVIFPLQVNEKLVICHQPVDEKLVINKNFKEFKRDIIKVNNDNLYDTVQDETLKQLETANKKNFPIDLNHIDVSEITDFDCLFDTINEELNKQNNKLRYIDISEWDVRNISSMRWMFYKCKDLVSVGDLSNWKIDNLGWANKMFEGCEKLEYIGDLSQWDIENTNYGPVDITNMFKGCKKLKKLPSWYWV